MERERLRKSEWACLAVIAAAFAVRLWYVLHPDVIWDTAWYLILAKSFGDTGTMVLPWADPPQYNGYWPPLFPIVASPIVKVFGASYSTIVLAATIMSALLALVVFLTTRDLMGRARAFGATVIVAVTPALMPSDFRGMSETTLELAVVLLLWTLLKSLKNKWFLLPSAACAVLVYLGKPNVGAPLVALALVPVAAWRIWSRGWKKVLRDPVDITIGLAAFVGIAVAVAYRSPKLGSVGITLIHPVGQSISFPLWGPFFAFKLAFAAVFLLFATLPFSLRAFRAMRTRPTEGEGYLWIFVALSLLATAVFTTSFLITEDRGPLDFHTVPEKFHESIGAGFTELFGLIGLLTDFDNVRYLSPAIVPFLWLVLPHWSFEDVRPEPARGVQGEEIRRTHWTWYGLAVGSYALLLLMSPMVLAASLERLEVTVLLALVPITLAIVAFASSYDVQERVSKQGAAARIVRAGQPTGAWILLMAGMGITVLVAWLTSSALVLLLGTVVTLVLVARNPERPRGLAAALAFTFVAAYIFASWFLLTTIGLLIAFSTRSPTVRVVAVGALLLCASCVEYVGGPPNDMAAHDISKVLPAGTVVGVTGIVPYFAASAPAHVVLRETSSDGPAPPGMDAVMATGVPPTFHDDNFTLVRSWDNTGSLFPTLGWRIAIERNLLSEKWDFPTPPVLQLYVRNGTAAAHAYGL